MKVLILVLNYNGQALLGECLPSVIESASSSRHEARVAVVDNASTDSSLEFLRRYGDDIDIIKHKNDFLCSFNDVVRDREGDIVILLNNDIKVKKDFIDPLVKAFDDHPDAFMVSPQCWSFDKTQYEGTRTRIGMRFGFFQAFARYPGYEKEIEKPGYTAAAGSIAAFRRDRFLELGGYDDLYLPGRVEDVDLCYRGWKRGYKAYYAPQSISYHKGLASFKRDFGYKKTLTLAYRNTFLFIWKNITDKGLLLKHIIFLLPWVLFSLLKLNLSFVCGFFQALPRLPQVLSRRAKEKGYFKKTDKELFELLGWKSSLS